MEVWLHYRESRAQTYWFNQRITRIGEAVHTCHISGKLAICEFAGYHCSAKTFPLCHYYILGIVITLASLVINHRSLYLVLWIKFSVALTRCAHSVQLPS